ncbi:hypothetical protein [Francisella sciaenopsi]|uniref:Lipoprotein n=1 Tax=Francisella sciaenopsi TaxID=3055034 RepID=A0ABQ6PG85_9GAMM
MKKKLMVLILVSLFISSCIPFLGGDMVVQDNRFEADGGRYGIQMQQGVTVKQVYEAIKEAIKQHPDQFEVKGDDYGDQKSTVWTYCDKYKEPVTFEATQRNGTVYLEVSMGEQGQAKRNMQAIYYIQDLVLNNLQQDNN